MRTWTGLAAASVSLVAPVLLIAGTAQAATPVAVWHMEDPGTMTDSSGNNNNGTTAGITSVPGSTGSGYHFESNSSVTVPDSTSLNPGTDDFSVTVHVRFDIAPAMGTDYDVIRKGVASTGGGEWKMEIFPNSTLSSPAFCLFKDVNGIAASVRGTTNLAGPDWHTITCAKSSTGVTVTVDGKLQRTNRTVLGSISNNASVGVGRKLPSGDQYLGDMDEVSIDRSPASPSDTTPPTVTATTPADGATGVAASTNVTATFSEPVQGVSGSTFTLTSAGGAVPASVTQGTGNQYILDPTADLAAGVTYTATLSGSITDTSKNAFAGTSWTFTTAAAPADTTPPTVTATTPADGATGVAVDANVTATFSEPVKAVNGTNFKLRNTATNTVVSATVTYDATSLTGTLNPGASLAAGTQYTATLTGGATAIRDNANNPLATRSWTFTTAGTASGGDTTPPTVTATTPASGATGVSRTADVTASFNEAVRAVNGTNFTLRKTSTGTKVSATVSYDATTHVGTLNPGVTLAANTTYTVTLTGGPAAIRDLANNPLTTVTWTFTTGP